MGGIDQSVALLAALTMGLTLGRAGRNRRHPSMCGARWEYTQRTRVCNGCGYTERERVDG